MELLRVEDAASISVFELRLSEDALEYFADSMAYVLRVLDDEALHNIFYDERSHSFQSPKETREFSERLYKQLMDLIKTYCKDEFLDDRFRQWIVSEPKEDDTE